MMRFEKVLKTISLTFGTIIFGFLAWLILVSQNFQETTAFIIGGMMIIAIFYTIYHWGYLFIGE